MLRQRDQYEEYAGLLDLLRAWKVENLYEHLKAQRVTIDVLKIIKIKHVEKLLREFDMGTQVYFEHHLEKWRESIGAPILNMCSESTLFRPGSKADSRSSTFSPAPQISNCSTPISTPEPEIGAGCKLLTVSLTTILNNSRKGRQMLDFYEQNKELKDENRTMLITLIAEYFDRNDIHLSLSATYILEQEIVKKFPSEKLVFYRTGKRGRIYNKYANLKSIAKHMSTNNEIPNKGDACSEATDLKPEKDAEMIVNAIKHDCLEPDEFERYWRACSKYRLCEIKNAQHTIEVLKQWPQYKLPTGYKLIEIDFATLFPNSPSILQTWESTQEKLINVLMTKGYINNKSVKDVLNNLNEVEKNGQELCALWATHGCLVPWQKLVTKGNDGKQHVTRYTIKDSQKAFVMLQPSVEALEEATRCLISEKIPIQPFLMVVGKDLKNVEKIFVYFDNIKFPFQSIIRAVDVCFKIFHVFNLEYPKACESFWAFIEIFFFKINSKINSPKINILCDALK